MKYLKKLRGLLLMLPLVGGWGAACTSTNPEPSLPPITQEGKNTFGCLINGKVWIPDFGGAGDIYNTPLTTAKYDPFRQGQFVLKAQKKGNDAIIYIAIIGTPTEKSYDLIKTDSFQIGGASVDFSKGANSLFCSDSRNLSYFKGKTIITKFDFQRRIAAGTFEFMLKSKNCTDTLKVTQGRFDMTF